MTLSLSTDVFRVSINLDGNLKQISDALVVLAVTNVIEFLRGYFVFRRHQNVWFHPRLPVVIYNGFRLILNHVGSILVCFLSVLCRCK